MQVLIHLGLNKCASTFIQSALASNRDALAAAGTFYPAEADRTAHYGLSRFYGFGPDAAAVSSYSLDDVLQQVRREGLSRLIVSSEYLSLFSPKAVHRIISDLSAHGCQVSCVLFSRDPFDWLQSLFNQYVKTVETGRYMRTINDFVDQILHNRSIDIARRVRQWQRPLAAAGQTLSLIRIEAETDRRDVLRPFEHFAGLTLDPPLGTVGNGSLDADALFRVGQLRQDPPGKERDHELSRLLAGGRTTSHAPDDYLVISPDRVARLNAEMVQEYQALDWCHLEDFRLGNSYDARLTG